MEGTTVTMASIIADIGSLFTAAMGWAQTVASTVAGNPLLLIFVLVPLVGLGIGIFRRLLNVQ